jgi:hypothetical protein
LNSGYGVESALHPLVDAVPVVAVFGPLGALICVHMHNKLAGMSMGMGMLIGMGLIIGGAAATAS